MKTDTLPLLEGDILTDSLTTHDHLAYQALVRAFQHSALRHASDEWDGVLGFAEQTGPQPVAVKTVLIWLS
uniref:Uncharacterized protein n=1 Tax=Streptomyces avermitilis TaxID=33903 RepID=A0A499V5Q1_STRAX|nr:hypothetical protein SAVMC3_03670 [Streptomyces avermitilis]